MSEKGETFDCKALKKPMTYTRCFLRQTKGVDPELEKYGLKTRAEGCRDCAQGEEIKERMLAGEDPAGGNEREPEPENEGGCLVCGGRYWARGLCHIHYGRWRDGKLEGFEPYERGKGPAPRTEPEKPAAEKESGPPEPPMEGEPELRPEPVNAGVEKGLDVTAPLPEGWLLLDMRDQAGLYDALVAAARYYMRSVHNQALYSIKRHLEEYRRFPGA